MHDRTRSPTSNSSGADTMVSALAAAVLLYSMAHQLLTALFPTIAVDLSAPTKFIQVMGVFTSLLSAAILLTGWSFHRASTVLVVGVSGCVLLATGCLVGCNCCGGGPAALYHGGLTALSVVSVIPQMAAAPAGGTFLVIAHRWNGRLVQRIGPARKRRARPK